MAAQTKQQIQETVDKAVEILEDAYEPETSREDLARAMGEALEELNPGEDEDEDEDEDGDE